MYISRESTGINPQWVDSQCGKAAQRRRRYRVVTGNRFVGRPRDGQHPIFVATAVVEETRLVEDSPICEPWNPGIFF